MTRPLPALAVAAALTLALAACGGDDDEPFAEPVVDEPAEPVDAPDATVAPDLPDEWAEAVGPVEVTGDPLPAFPEALGDADPAVGTAAPVLTGLTPDGEPIEVGAPGRETLVAFLAHWCSHCNAEVPVLNAIDEDGEFPAGLRVVAVTTASDPRAPNYPPADWLDDNDWRFETMLDGVDLVAEGWIGSTAYGVSGFPAMVLLDADGNVAARWSGELGRTAMVEIVNDAL